MAKFYAVKEGRRPGIYRTWDECKEQTSGYSGAVFKSFKIKEDAVNYLEQNEHKEKDLDLPRKSVGEDLDFSSLERNLGLAYVDGSYNLKEKKVGFGLVLLTREGRKDFKGCEKSEEMASYRNVAGELLAVRMAIEKALELPLRKLVIYHDYSGIRHWALGEWKRNNDLTKAYHEYYKNITNKLEVEFVKVDAHTGDFYNEEADKLAKEACKN